MKRSRRQFNALTRALLVLTVGVIGLSGAARADQDDDDDDGQTGMALFVIISLGALSIFLSSWIEYAMQQRHDADTQMHNQRLARYIADRQREPFIDGDGRVNSKLLVDTAMRASMIHPSLKLYLLDPDGRILQHTLGDERPSLERVDLTALAELMTAGAPRLPIYGDDPRLPEHRSLVSIAPLPDDEHVRGYLYIVLQGQRAQQIQQRASVELQHQTAWRVIVVALALAAIVIVVAQTGITRRLRTLASNLEQFRQADDHSMAPRCEVGDEIDQVRCAAQTLQQRVVDQFKRIEDAERLRPELISNISHDLHTPLANIQGYVETLLVRGDHLSRVEREQYLRTSLQHCRSLSRRVAELFELSKLESGRAQISAEPFCMAELLNDVVQSYALNAESRGICVRLSDDANRQARVCADIALIERVLQNLVDNALRHTPSGGHVELSVDAAGALVRVSVRDSGQGIDAADLPHIFERYWTGGSTSGHASDCDPSRTSAGLGLAIARLIVELHGCQIGVRSAPQRGTEFSFALPVAAGSG